MKRYINCVVMDMTRSLHAEPTQKRPSQPDWNAVSNIGECATDRTEDNRIGAHLTIRWKSQIIDVNAHVQKTQ